MKQVFTVDKLFDSCGVIYFLRSKFLLSYPFACSLIRRKDVKINSVNAKLDSTLKTGDVVSIYARFLDKEHKSVNADASLDINNNSWQKKLYDKYNIKNRIVLNNEYVVCINKPRGLSVQGGSKLSHSMEDLFPFICSSPLHIVHRLDKDTSGLILCAKSKDVAASLGKMFADRLVKKRYLAILSSVPLQSSGVINANILNTGINVCTNDSGDVAVTNYNVIKVDKDLNIALVEFFPLTGRKHQIRVHARYINCPILGDEKYGGRLDLCSDMQLFSTMIVAEPFCNISISDEIFLEETNLF